jgi:AcrR family transcriptional regulator
MEVARELFARRGLDQVTIEALAPEAEVSTATVYGLFKSKAGLLRALIEASLFNDRYQSLVAGLRGVVEPTAMLRMTAAIARAIYDGERAQLGLVRGASAFSSELRDSEQQFEQIRYDAQRDRARRIAQPDTLALSLLAAPFARESLPYRTTETATEIRSDEAPPRRGAKRSPKTTQAPPRRKS